VEARLVEADGALVPEGEGWFVVSARDARWVHSPELGAGCILEGTPGRFPELGITIRRLEPGRPSTMYHAETAQEGFLVLDGGCLLLIEGEERQLRKWDFVHCPAGTAHSFVGGEQGCMLLCVGARRTDREVRYLVSELALRHAAGVERETSDPREAYAAFSPRVAAPAPALP